MTVALFETRPRIAATAESARAKWGAGATGYLFLLPWLIGFFGLTLGPPLGFDDTFAIVIRGEDARRLNLRTLSQAAAFAPEWRAGFGYEFMERPDGYKGLAATYGLRFAEAPRIMDLGLITRALKDRQVDLIAGNNTDGLIPALDLFVLEDDRHYFPPYVWVDGAHTRPGRWSRGIGPRCR